MICCYFIINTTIDNDFIINGAAGMLLFNVLFLMIPEHYTVLKMSNSVTLKQIN